MRDQHRLWPHLRPLLLHQRAVSGTPPYYNRDGELLRGFFLRDAISAHLLYAQSRHFFWDRFNFGLPVHFYGHGAMLETMGHPDHRYGIFVESEGIIPQHYDIFRRHPGLERDFDAVFTYSDRLLDTLPNARFFAGCATIWYGREQCNGQPDPATLTETAYARKTKGVSMMCSPKRLTPMQILRHRIAREAQRTGKIDLFGGACGSERIPFKSSSLTEYRFQIAIENDLQPFYFTEKLLDCFAAQTIPVYLGASRIADFFNPDGIIPFTPGTPIERLLAQCTPAEYERRLPAVLDNYHRALQYLNPDDRLL